MGVRSSGATPGNFNDDGEIKVNNTDNLITVTADYAGAETDTVLITPASGKKLQIHNVFVSTNVNNVDVIIDFTTSGNIVFKLYTTQQQTAAGAIVHIEGAVDETLEITCGAGTFVTVTYHEV